MPCLREAAEMGVTFSVWYEEQTACETSDLPWHRLPLGLELICSVSISKKEEERCKKISDLSSTATYCYLDGISTSCLKAVFAGDAIKH